MHSPIFVAALVAALASSVVAVPQRGRTSSTTRTTSTIKPTPVTPPATSSAPNFYYTTSPGAPAPRYVTLTKCNQPQTSGAPDAWMTTVPGGGVPTCTTSWIAYTTAVPQSEQEIASQGNTPYLLHGIPLSGYNSAFSFGSNSLNCVICTVANCQQTSFSYAVSFYGNLYDTTNVWLGPGKVSKSWGTYIMCAIPGQPMVGLTDPVNGGGYVMPGEFLQGNAVSRAPVPIPATLGTPVVLPTPPPM